MLMSDIVDRLREDFLRGEITIWNILPEAADEIERQQSRIRELEGHLSVMVKEFTDHHYPGCPKDESDSNECECYAGVVTAKAAAALTQQGVEHEA